MYFTSFRCNRILFRWYTNKEWQRSFFMRQLQLQKVKVVKVKVESWEYLLNFQIDWEETTTVVKNCAGSSRIWLSPPPPRLPSPPHLWVPPITEAEASSSGQKILSSCLLLWVTPWPSLEGGATDNPHNHGVSESRPSRAEVPPLVFGMIAKKKVDGGQVDDEIVMIEMMELWWNRLKNNLKLWRVAGYTSSFLYTWFYTYVCMKQKTNF